MPISDELKSLISSLLCPIPGFNILNCSENRPKIEELLHLPAVDVESLEKLSIKTTSPPGTTSGMIDKMHSNLSLYFDSSSGHHIPETICNLIFIV